jgi:hypothetical protein
MYILDDLDLRDDDGNYKIYALAMSGMTAVCGRTAQKTVSIAEKRLKQQEAILEKCWRSTRKTNFFRTKGNLNSTFLGTDDEGTKDASARVARNRGTDLTQAGRRQCRKRFHSRDGECAEFQFR